MKRKSKIIGIIGLGRMGGNLALNLKSHGWEVVGFNRTKEVTKEFEKKGITPAYSLTEFIANTNIPNEPRVIILMVSPNAVDELIFSEGGIAQVLEKGDILIDAGNSHYEKDAVRYEKTGQLGIQYVDVGISGGPDGARNGACLMVGGKKETFDYLEAMYKDISVLNGYMHFEGRGAGHFVKMVHNGIEYGMMQSIAEGFNLMKHSKFGLNLKDVTHIYNHGSVVESRLIGWLKDAYEKYGEDLKELSGSVGHTGEGLWTIKAAKKMHQAVPVIERSYNFRVDSEKNPSYIGRVLTGMRNVFGHHSIKKGKMT